MMGACRLPQSRVRSLDTSITPLDIACFGQRLQVDTRAVSQALRLVRSVDGKQMHFAERNAVGLQQGTWRSRGGRGDWFIARRTLRRGTSKLDAGGRTLVYPTAAIQVPRHVLTFPSICTCISSQLLARPSFLLQSLTLRWSLQV